MGMGLGLGRRAGGVASHSAGPDFRYGQLAATPLPFSLKGRSAIKAALATNIENPQPFGRIALVVAPLLSARAGRGMSRGTGQRRFDRQA